MLQLVELGTFLISDFAWHPVLRCPRQRRVVVLAWHGGSEHLASDSRHTVVRATVCNHLEGEGFANWTAQLTQPRLRGTDIARCALR